jgi:hypothetical protein
MSAPLNLSPGRIPGPFWGPSVHFCSLCARSAVVAAQSWADDAAYRSSGGGGPGKRTPPPDPATYSS